MTKVNMRKRQPRRGYVYLLRSTSGYYKIGHTKDPNDRRKTFNVKLPFEVEFEHIIPCDDMLATESRLHSLFALKRVNQSEFFSLSARDVMFIKSMKHGSQVHEGLSKTSVISARMPNELISQIHEMRGAKTVSEFLSECALAYIEHLKSMETQSQNRSSGYTETRTRQTDVLT